MGWPLVDDGQPSNSLRRAETYGIPIASEPEFLDAAGITPHREETRTYTMAQIVRLAKLPESAIKQLSLFGLLTPSESKFGFGDLAAARQVADLFSKGVKLSTITHSLREIRKWLPNADLPSLRLEPDDDLFVAQIAGRTNVQGQFVLPLGATVEDPDVIFENAQSAEEMGDFVSAERLYRLLQRLDPEDPTASFNLANLFRDQGQLVEAEAALRAAITIDKKFSEAWFNLSDLLDRAGNTREAIDCLHNALKSDEYYSDAIFNLGLLQQKGEQFEDATKSWRRYLDLDENSPWAERARRALKYCEMREAAESLGSDFGN